MNFQNINIEESIKRKRIIRFPKIVDPVLKKEDQISIGAKKDLLIVSFCHAIFSTSKMSNVVGHEPIKNHKLRNKIMRKCEMMESICHDIFQANGYRLGPLWLKKNMKKRIIPALAKAEADNPQLESFALYVLYINFLDNRQKKVDEIFKPILDKEDEIFTILDDIATAREAEPAEMYELAIKTIEILKG